MIYKTFFHHVEKTIAAVMDTQGDKIQQAARIVADCFARDGMLYVFGCGHSHIIGEDLFYRAGGSAAVCAMLDSDLMLHGGAVKSSHYEKMHGLAAPVFDRYGITEKDVLLVVSTSGINPVPIEMALCGKEKGIPVLAIVSNAYSQDVSRHSGGQKLHDVADLVLDNGASHGDAAVMLGDSDIQAGPVSTITGSLIAQCVVLQAEEYLLEMGMKPPVYVSGNVPGGMERNQDLIRRYMPRNKHL